MLINVQEVLKKFGPGNAEMPETGVNSHTKDVRPYHVTHKVCMVDFPGGNGIGDHADRWQQCSLLPGSAILFLDFKVQNQVDRVIPALFCFESCVGSFVLCHISYGYLL